MKIVRACVSCVVVAGAHEPTGLTGKSTLEGLIIKVAKAKLPHVLDFNATSRTRAQAALSQMKKYDMSGHG